MTGILTHDHLIDTHRMTLVRQASSPLLLTFHRAFDVVALPLPGCHSLTLEDSLQQVIDLGCDRLLTSGQALSAPSEAGIASLRRLAEHAKSACSSLKIVAAAGVTADNCAHVIMAAGVNGVHAGGSVTVKEGKLDRCSGDGSEVDDFNLRHVVSVQRVTELVHSIASI